MRPAPSRAPAHVPAVPSASRAFACCGARRFCVRRFGSAAVVERCVECSFRPLCARFGYMGLFDIFRRTKAVESPPPDPRELFAREVEQVLAQDDSVRAVVPDPENFAISVKVGEEDYVLYLANAYAETRDLSPEDRRNHIRRLISVVQPLTEVAWEEARSNLMLTVRACTFGANPEADKGSYLGRPFVPFLEATLVLDEPDSMRYLVRSQLERWQVAEEEAFAVAMQNAASAATAPLELYASTHGSAWHVPGEDVYASSRLLLPGWLESMKDRVEGRPLAIIPERSMLFVGGDARPEMVRWLADAAQREHDASNRSISPAVYTVDEAGTVVPYRSTGGDEIANLVRMGHTKLLGQTYEEQKALLEPYYEKIGFDVFVATVSVLRLNDGRPLSWCTWAEGIESLLPKTDVVMVGGSAHEERSTWRASVPFEIAKGIAGALWTTAEVPFGPERFKASGAISPDQKAALLAASRPLDQCI